MPHKKKFTMRKKIAVPKEKLIYVERFFFSLDAICRLNKIISLFIEEGMQKRMGYTSKYIERIGINFNKDLQSNYSLTSLTGLYSLLILVFMKSSLEIERERKGSSLIWGCCNKVFSLCVGKYFLSFNEWAQARRLKQNKIKKEP